MAAVARLRYSARVPTADDDLKPAPRAATPEVLIPVDPRLLEANERTLLAWIRTAVSIMAFGFVVGKLGLWLYEMGQMETRPGEFSVWTGAVLVGLGASCNIVAALRYWRIHQALLAGRPVRPALTMAMSVAAALGLLGVGLTAYLLIR